MDYKLRSIDDSDKERILNWRNSDRVRQNMYTDHLITPEEHESWFNKIHQDKSVDYKIFEYEGRSIGLVGFTQINKMHNQHEDVTSLAIFEDGWAAKRAEMSKLLFKA